MEKSHLIIATTVAAFYSYTPCRGLINDKKNLFMLPVIFIIVYILLAWYDWVYKCKAKMYSGSLGFSAIADSLFKPQRRLELDKYPRDDLLLPPREQEGVFRRNTYIFHLAVIMPMIMYIGWKGAESSQKVYQPTLAIGILAASYHGLRLIIPREVCVDDQANTL